MATHRAQVKCGFIREQQKAYPVTALFRVVKVSTSAFYAWLAPSFEPWQPIQYASHDYRKHLAIMKMEQSMSRQGNCWDNSPTERLSRSLKHEQLNDEKFKTKASAKLSIINNLAFYNGKRPHSTLG